LLSTKEHSELLSRIGIQLNSILNRNSIETVSDLGQYHCFVNDAVHMSLWSKRNRILSRDDSEWFLSLDSVVNLLGMLGTTLISDEESLSRPNIYWRLVRPNSPSDVGPLHRDEWFWELNNYFGYPDSKYIRTKIWIPLIVEKSLNSLLVSPGSHADQNLQFSKIYRDGIYKPVLDSNSSDVSVKMTDAAVGDAVIFHDRLVHGGSLNLAGTTRFSMEFTCMSSI